MNEPPLTKDIPIDQIRPFISRARGKEGFDQLKASMRQYGLQIPVQVIDLGKRDADGKRYELICGEGRTEAARQLRWEKIPALIIEAPEVEIAGRFMAENLMRKSLPWAVKGKMVKQLEGAGLSMKEIADGLNISLGLAEKYRRILDKKGAEEVEALPVNDAEVLTTLPANKQRIVMEVVKETGQSVKAIVEKAREVKKAKGEGWTKAALRTALQKDDETLKRQRETLKRIRLHHALGPVNIRTLMRSPKFLTAAASHKLNLSHFQQ